MTAFILALEKGMRLLVGAVMISIMVIVVADVLLRYAFRAPLTWTHDVISLYLMVAVFYLTLSGSYGARHHVSVDLLYRHIPVRTRNLLRAGFSLVAAVLIVLIAWQVGERAFAGFLRGDRLSGGFPWPTWVAGFIAAFGCIVFVLRLLTEAAILTAGAGRFVDETDPLVRTGLSD